MPPDYHDQHRSGSTRTQLEACHGIYETFLQWTRHWRRPSGVSHAHGAGRSQEQQQPPTHVSNSTNSCCSATRGHLRQFVITSMGQCAHPDAEKKEKELDVETPSASRNSFAVCHDTLAFYSLTLARRILPITSLSPVHLGCLWTPSPAGRIDDIDDDVDEESRPQEDSPPEGPIYFTFL